jgi:hypothetical protein
MAFAIILVMASLGFPAAEREESNVAHEQTIFTEGGPLQRSVPLSADVLKVLLATKEAKQGLAFVGESQQSNVTQLFRASEVHLSGPKEVDLVVIGVPPMAGVDHGWFWLVRSARKNPEILLFAGGDSLELMESRTLGYRDIRSVLPLASETHFSVYHYDDEYYKLWKEKWEQAYESTVSLLFVPMAA